jgi:hypothetical protein
MPLHRDIFWVGKQWSVTGHGMQAIDQRLKGEFDIEISRIWDEDLHDALNEKKWFNAADFEKGLAEARKHYPLPAGKTPPKPRPILAVPAPDAVTVKDVPNTTPSPNPPPANFTLRIVGCRAKFLPSWRVRTR